ncbi:Bzip transcription factor Pap1 bound To Dna, partial [Scheffersomyces coipomensis]
RKPIETEPKSKRTAQNRAAQRAYRERKERKMKDLEDKVKNLEDKNIKVTTEADFLKAQVEMLKKEL